ncbi:MULTISPECIES: hypothetical protein [Pseudoalteromonas]|uniref:Uncharacterized protein n=1 Tax=Pseudoalteromonas rubra TaxID=43658 RepID=A0A5S3USY4_9GAMM|nr:MULTISPECIES: hypothetical protein [Pseudoalteromonas]MCG7563525.1 hypothetical protein [Pseudoalteromonas sp. McH1-42]QPB82715.1 hypothetical protein CWC22_006785 [Pseudoalteromonas rubra]
MKFFIKRLNKKAKTSQLEGISNMSVESVQLVTGGSGSGNGAQPKMQRFSPEAKTVYFGG